MTKRNPHFNIKGGVDFSYVTADAFISSEADRKPIFDEDVRSYNIKRYKKNGDYQVYEVFRKGKRPIRRATIKSSNKKQKLTIPEAIAKFKSKKPKWNYKTKYDSSLGKDYKMIKTYQSYAPTRQQMKTGGKIQAQLLVDVILIKNPNINGTYVGYSSAKYYNTIREDISVLYDEAIASAILGFHNDHPSIKAKSGELECHVLQERFIRWQDKRIRPS